MLIPCPVCGQRDAGEFFYRGDATAARPPLEEEAERPWVEYVYARHNPRGEHLEFWQHAHGCRQLLVVRRNTETHEVFEARLVGPFGEGG
ncbi:sarcosine oxidase subunit delta [Afifella pfennigii]|uniref:sarcosine oxidase subunit delta n=1 Tax=Afifella pfennigii TaxID=209897 RepID=UPI00047EE836|nr:sarcosine oxidase subunit delta [Afifella pfennigii]